MAGYLGYDVLGTFRLGVASLTPTTLRATAAAVSAAIRGITPNYELFADAPWSPVDRVEDVPGSVLRLFCCEWDPAIPVEDGIYGDDAQEHIARLRVYTNYARLPEVDDDAQDVHAEMPTSDGNQLRVALDAIVDPATDGVISFAAAGFEWESAEPGHAWGAHQFDVRILLAH